MSIEAMKQAIEALKGYRLETNEAAIKALHQAIEQADHIPDTTKMMPTGKDSLQVEAMKQALEALALFASDESDEGQIAIAAHEELRKAIEQAEKDEADFQDFVAQLQEVEKEACEIIRSSQEPVAWGMVKDGEIYDCITPAEHDREPGEYTVPLYAAYGWQSVTNPTEYLDDLRGGADE